MGCQGEYGAMYKNATCYYTSDVIHRVDLTNLKSGTRYTYQLDGHTEWVDFMTPPALGEPITLAFTADLGQTQDSNLTMTHMRQAWDEGKYHAVVFPGDLSYADGAPLYWDAYGRLVTSCGRGFQQPMELATMKLLLGMRTSRIFCRGTPGPSPKIPIQQVLSGIRSTRAMFT